jgi:hypothetical protein
MEKIETNVVKPQISYIENEQNYRTINEEVEQLLDGKISSVVKFISEKTGKGQSDSIKDELYLQGQNLWKELSQSLKDAKYNFHLDRPQHKFLTDLVLNKLEYDVNTVFFAIELKELFDFMKDSKYKNDTELQSYSVTATEITYIYHLISKYNVKGLNKEAYLFAEVLMKIGNISKIFNYYETQSKNLATEIQDWVLTFDDNVSKEKLNNVETVTGMVV